MTVQPNAKRQIMNSSSPEKPKGCIDTPARFVCYAALWFAAQFPAAAQNSFTDAEADGIKAFLRNEICRRFGLAWG